MTREESLQIIRDSFSHVDVLDIFVEYDSIVEEEVAKVVVSEDQLSEALRENGLHARQAAMQSGLSVEVVLSE